MKIIKNIIAAAFSCLAIFTLASCDNSSKTTDYAGNLKLETPYAGKEYKANGIGEVTLYNNVDGDTAWFYTGKGDQKEEIKIRFVSVDTPESTGLVEPWGKAASEFTANILSNAETIVLQAHDGKAATLDSTGTRWLAFVWYRLDATSDLRNLNLELVQNGYSKSKVTDGSIYGSVFNEAATQAMNQKLFVWSRDEDPKYDYSNGVELDIKEIATNAKDYVGKRVNFEAIVSRKDSSYAYVENTVDGTKYGMLVFMGYDSNVAYAYTPGNKLRIHGFIQEYNGTYQVSGCVYDRFEYGSTDSERYAKYVRILAKNQVVEPTVVTESQINEGKVCTATLVKMENLRVISVYQNNAIVGDTVAKEMTITCKTADDKEVQFRTSTLYAGSNPIGENYFKGKTMESVMGIVTIYNSKYQVRIVSINDVIFQA